MLQTQGTELGSSSPLKEFLLWKEVFSKSFNKRLRTRDVRDLRSHSSNGLVGAELGTEAGSPGSPARAFCSGGLRETKPEDLLQAARPGPGLGMFDEDQRGLRYVLGKQLVAIFTKSRQPPLNIKLKISDACA